MAESIVIGFEITINDEHFTNAIKSVERAMRHFAHLSMQPNAKSNIVKQMKNDLKNFEDDLAKELVKLVVYATTSLIDSTRATTGNMASAWHVSFDRNDTSEVGAYHGNHEVWSIDFMRAHAFNDSGIARGNMDRAQNRERGNVNELQRSASKKFRIYVANQAYIDHPANADFSYGFYATEGIGRGIFEFGSVVSSEDSASYALFDYLASNVPATIQQMLKKHHFD